VINLNTFVDLTYLKPDSTRERIEQLCQEAMQYQVWSVCVPPYFVPQVSRILEDSSVKVCTVIGFPYGYQFSQSKAEEIRKAIEDQVEEIDLVVNISAIKSGDWSYVMNEIDSLTRLCHMRNILAKWIIEMNALNDEEIAHICKICTEKEVDFVKTGTGTFGDAVTPSDIQKLRQLLPAQIKIKASGGIRNREQGVSLIEAGAERLGTSSIKLLLPD